MGSTLVKEAAQQAASFCFQKLFFKIIFRGREKMLNIYVGLDKVPKDATVVFDNEIGFLHTVLEDTKEVRWNALQELLRLKQGNVFFDEGFEMFLQPEEGPETVKVNGIVCNNVLEMEEACYE